MYRISVMLILFFWILPVLSCGESPPQRYVDSPQSSESSSGNSSPSPTSEPSLSPKEVLDEILDCVRSGDTFGAKQYMTSGMLNKRYGVGRVDVIYVLQVFVRNQSRYDYECLQNQISGSPATIFYRLYLDEWHYQMRTIEDHKFILGKVSSKWLLDDISYATGTLYSDGGVNYPFGWN